MMCEPHAISLRITCNFIHSSNFRYEVVADNFDGWNRWQCPKFPKDTPEDVSDLIKRLLEVLYLKH